LERTKRLVGHATTALSGLMLAVPAAAQTAVQDIGGLSTTIASSRPAS
jgi:hypothetical protein